MANVIVDKNKIDLLANAISAKSGEPLTLTLDEMVEAVDGIETGGGGITPTGNIDITQAGVTDVTNYATATVPEAFIIDDWTTGEFFTQNGVRKWRAYGTIAINPDGWIEGGNYDSAALSRNAIPTGTSVTPTESAQTIGGANMMMEGAVTVNAIPSNYVGSGITRRSSSDLTASGATVSVPSGFYENNASKAVASGTEGTPTASKGTVTNHSVTVTPSVTNGAGYISGGTHTGTGVTVSASELVSGSQTITINNTYDVTNLAEVVVDVQGGGGGVTQDANGYLVLDPNGGGGGGGGGGISGVAKGTLTVASAVSSGNVEITTVSEIGFTPTKFFFFSDETSLSGNYIAYATYVSIASKYSRVRAIYDARDSIITASGYSNSWTMTTSGCLYYGGGTIYINTSSSTILGAGTYTWIAVE